MSIRFTCLSCRTMLKIGEMVAEPRKVRCTGCSIVILVEPDPLNPREVKTSIPEQSLNKTKSRSDKALAQKRNLLLGLGAVVLLSSIGGLWWNLQPPDDRGSIEGWVKLDNEPLERGEISFISQDGKNIIASTLINQGHYMISANDGPMIGKNRVEIRGEQTTGLVINPGVELVADRYNTKSKEIIEIKPGANKKDFDVKSH